MKLKAPFIVRLGLLWMGIVSALIFSELPALSAERIFFVILSLGSIVVYVWESGRFVKEGPK